MPVALLKQAVAQVLAFSRNQLQLCFSKQLLSNHGSHRQQVTLLRQLPQHSPVWKDIHKDTPP